MAVREKSPLVYDPAWGETDRLAAWRHAVADTCVLPPVLAATILAELPEAGTLSRRAIAALVGVVFVAAVLAMVQVITRIESLKYTHAAVESLTIIAWVALWRPAELLLYEHWPVRRQRQLARRLAQARITLRAR